MLPADWCLLLGRFLSQWWAFLFFLTLLLPLAAPIYSFNVSSWKGGQGDAHKGGKSVTAFHHGAPNDAAPVPLTEEKVATGATGMGGIICWTDEALLGLQGASMFFASNDVNKTWKLRYVILVLFQHMIMSVLSIITVKLVLKSSWFLALKRRYSFFSGLLIQLHWHECPKQEDEWEKYTLKLNLYEW